jgi:hypothetical protein
MGNGQSARWGMGGVLGGGGAWGGAPHRIGEALEDERPTLLLIATHSALGPHPWALVFPCRYDRLWQRLLAW